MTITIETVAIDGQFWVHLSMDNYPMEPRGPWSDPDQAEAAACRIAAISRALKAEVHFAMPATGARKR